MGSLEMFHSEIKACPQDISDKDKKFFKIEQLTEYKE